MGPDAWITIAVLVLILGLLTSTRYAADIILLGGLTLLMVIPTPTGEDNAWTPVLPLDQALTGFSNPGMLAVGVLFVVVAGLRETGVVEWIAHRVLGRPKSLLGAQSRIVAPVSFLSAFLNNTPVVAMMIPAINDWARKLQFSPSKLLLPLSYAAILGGTCTLIGTSTNLVVNGELIKEAERGTPGLPTSGLNMFDITWIGLPCALIGLTYILLVSRFLIPERRPARHALNNPREYTTEMLVQPNSPLVGQTIEQAGLRHLPNMYLLEIERDGHVLPAVSPTERLQPDDRLVFTGVVDSVKELHNFRGLTPATDQVFKLNSPRHQRRLVEAVVSDACPLVGKSIREGRFRSVYNAAVIAVARGGQRIRAKIGDIVLRPGDTLLMEAPGNFVDQQRNSRDFFLISQVEDSVPRRHEKSPIAVIILLAMVAAVTFRFLNLLPAALLAAGLMIVTRCCTATTARQSVDWRILLVIAAAFGIGRAMQITGAAQAIASSLVNFAGQNPWLVLAVIYLLTALFTELITNNVAAILMFPIAIATANNYLDVNPMPFVIVVMIAASAAFATPLGYQTNLMVYGPGGYRFTDYLRLGLPLTCLIGATTVLLTPLIWPFHP